MNDRQILRCIGKNVQTARLQAGLTQECLAELVGVHWKTLGRIERGLFPFAVTHFVRIAQHLEIGADRLLEGIAPPDLKRTTAIRKALPRRRRPKNAKPLSE